ncbi:acylamino-acid-releasing enzyme-like isoform X1 [Carcharodon carcharias]|uniref:acylamino-acid-releasing enzyme-like isoform X1 n=1 Tax=Carcharodon carcharias TaxID=13397 RepID=UPI001B7DB5E2|nr:acylamino-acid-releasing enzyme-like isoform X1 [Carcharodon carcharias]XP_041046802.1 acylamino-acid-releasing enzyme-like isoform X1 [Carcharodon carcharias]XP_041046803.1 acylamino-acid-releasing enzyme-like isoform X1 [Carcharodon carcharias]
MLTGSEEIAGIYQEFSKFPNPLKGWTGSQVSLKHGGKYCTIYSEWSQRDLERAEWVKFCREYIVFCDENSIVHTCPSGKCTELRGELLNRASPSGTLKAVLRGHTNKKGEEQQYLEIWSKTSKESSINLTALDKHGKVYEDDQFGCLAWSHSETHILYIAEKKRPKTASFFQTKLAFSAEEENYNSNKSKKCQKPVQGDQYLYWEDWGETLVKRNTPVLCVLDIESGNIFIMQGIPEHISPGQAIWAPKDTGIIFVGWWHLPWRLGLKYCTNRKSALYCVDLTGSECLQISSGVNSVRSPRLSPDQRHVIYLEGGNVKTHHQCYNLSLYNLDNKEISTVVKIVDYPIVDGFTGIYSSELALNCWASDSQRVIIDTAQRSRKDLIIVNSATGIVTSLITDSEAGSWTLLDIHQDLMVVSCSSPNCPPALKVGFLPAAGKEQGIAWVALDEAEPLPEIDWKILTFTPPFEQANPKFPGLQFESILLIPGHEKEVKPPLVVIPHGGPNSIFVVSWMLLPVALCKLGYAVLLVNYRGSSGFGQDSIRSLPGNIGSQDVKDVQYAVESVLKEGCVDSDKVLLIGGSHGGFIGCHLICQYPGFYKAFATRNPVINLVSKLGTTDIPDHTMVQAGFDFAPDQLPTPSVLTALLSKSPITCVSQVRTPVLIMLGEKDKRIHPTQGLELYRALRARSAPVRLLWYPDDNHSLSKVGTEADVFMNIALWFVFALDITNAA